MRIQFTVEPWVYDQENKTIRMKLLFESNVNMAQSCIEKIYRIDEGLDLRKRLLDDMFYELRQRINEQEKAFDELLEYMKGGSNG